MSFQASLSEEMKRIDLAARNHNYKKFRRTLERYTSSIRSQEELSYYPNESTKILEFFSKSS